MAKASTAPASSIDPREAAHFGRLAADWWNPRGSSAMLHRLNPVRLAFVRRAIDAHWPGATGFTPLAGKRALDVGCGAGLLAEPLARMGAAVTGLDAAPENIGAAQAHAAAMGLAIDYRAVGVETLADGERFDLVTAMEVIEHVTDPAGFVAALARVLAPGGLLILSTPNRTALSRLAMVGVAEATGMIPRGTHDWDKFLTPDQLDTLLRTEGLAMDAPTGIAWSPFRGLHLGDDLSLNYICTATHANR